MAGLEQQMRGLAVSPALLQRYHTGAQPSQQRAAFPLPAPGPGLVHVASPGLLEGRAASSLGGQELRITNGQTSLARGGSRAREELGQPSQLDRSAIAKQLVQQSLNNSKAAKQQLLQQKQSQQQQLLQGKQSAQLVQPKQQQLVQQQQQLLQQQQIQKHQQIQQHQMQQQQQLLVQQKLLQQQRAGSAPPPPYPAGADEATPPPSYTLPARPARTANQVALQQALARAAERTYQVQLPELKYDNLF